MLARVSASCQAVPPYAGVGREGLHQAMSPFTPWRSGWRRWHDALANIFFHQVRAHAVSAKQITLSADGFPVETFAAAADVVGSRETKRASTTKIENARQVFFLDMPISFLIGRTNELVGSDNAIRLLNKATYGPQVGLLIDDIGEPACSHPARLVILYPKISAAHLLPKGSPLAAPRQDISLQD